LSIASRRYDNLYRKNDPTAVLRVELIEVLYAPMIWQWCSILRSRADASRAADLGYPKGTLPTGGECARAFMGKYALERQVCLLELPATHEPLVIASEHLTMSTIVMIASERLTMATIMVIAPEYLTMANIVVIAPEYLTMANIVVIASKHLMIATMATIVVKLKL
jgi:hypothetical protein